MLEAAGSTRRAAEACRPEGRPLYAGHASLEWPDEPHLVLWHAITLLREFRGDGHVAALLEADVDGCEALVTHAASGEIPAAALQMTPRVERRRVGGCGRAPRRTRPGRRRPAASPMPDARCAGEIEGRTDALALAPWASIGEDACAALRETVRPLSRAIVESGRFGFDARSPR